jgi:acetyl-CoA carboxylase alpha subunit
MTKNSEVYGVKHSIETRTILKTDSIVDSIIDEHITRAEMGKEKYNNTLDRTDLSVLDYLQHAKEEAMDLALYLEKTIQMLKGKK